MELESVMFNVITSVFLLINHRKNIVKSLHTCIILAPVFNFYSVPPANRKLLHYMCRINFLISTEKF